MVGTMQAEPGFSSRCFVGETGQFAKSFADVQQEQPKLLDRVHEREEDLRLSHAYLFTRELTVFGWA